MRNYELQLKGKWDFEKKDHRFNGVQYLFKFENGYSASVVKFDFSYGVDEDLWELAVLKDGNLHYDNPVADGDVRGYLTDEEVEKLLEEIKDFKK